MKPTLIAPLTIAIGLGFSGGGAGFGSMPFIDGTPFSNLDINKGRHYTFS
jgi:hypothetical protein